MGLTRESPKGKSRRSVLLDASQDLVVRKQRRQVNEPARREQRDAAKEGGGL